MRVLVVVDAAHGCDHADGCGPIDGELATLLTVRHQWQDASGVVSETDHVLGIETGHLATAAEVVAIDVPREVIVDSVHEALLRRGPWDDADVAAIADALAAGMLNVASQYPVGTVLEQGGDGTRLWPRLPKPSVPPRPRVCERWSRGAE